LPRLFGAYIGVVGEDKTSDASPFELKLSIQKNCVMKLLALALALALAAAQAETTDVTPCIGKSAQLKPAQCAAWQDIFDGIELMNWDFCNKTRNDPCSCRHKTSTFGESKRIRPLGNPPCGDDYDACVTCANGDVITIMLYKDIVEGRGGTLPSSIGQFTSMTHLLLDYNSIGGTVPSQLAELKQLKFIDLIGNSMSGELPALPFGQYTGDGKGYCCLADRVDDGNHFNCPLPPASEQCRCPDIKGPGVVCGNKTRNE
jgi:hypothetical protein